MNDERSTLIILQRLLNGDSATLPGGAIVRREASTQRFRAVYYTLRQGERVRVFDANYLRLHEAIDAIMAHLGYSLRCSPRKLVRDKHDDAAYLRVRCHFKEDAA